MQASAQLWSCSLPSSLRALALCGLGTSRLPEPVPQLERLYIEAQRDSDFAWDGLERLAPRLTALVLTECGLRTLPDQVRRGLPLCTAAGAAAAGKPAPADSLPIKSPAALASQVAALTGLRVLDLSLNDAMLCNLSGLLQLTGLEELCLSCCKLSEPSVLPLSTTRLQVCGRSRSRSLAAGLPGAALAL